MNPLTQVKNQQKITARESAAGISEEGSWHAKYKDSAYIYIGGLPFDLTEGDVLAVFAQYGEIVDLNLVRDKGTGKPKGFAYVAYEDQRSTTLAVDNLNGAMVLGRIIRVDHKLDYKRKKPEDEEEQGKREERGVCYAFQRGECNRGDACKFSHDEKRNENMGWGKTDDEPRWKHDNFQPYKLSTKDSRPRNDYQTYKSRDQDRRFRDDQFQTYKTRDQERKPSNDQSQIYKSKDQERRPRDDQSQSHKSKDQDRRSRVDRSQSHDDL